MIEIPVDKQSATTVFPHLNMDGKKTHCYIQIAGSHLVGDGYRLSPLTECPRAVYKLMAQCW